MLLEAVPSAAAVPYKPAVQTVFSLSDSRVRERDSLVGDPDLSQQDRPQPVTLSPGLRLDTERTFSTFQTADVSAPAWLDAPPAWRQVAAELAACASHGEPQRPPSVLVCGPKQAGKSTLGKLLVNSLLNAHPVVAFLDTDCGQPEFTPPGACQLGSLRATAM